MKSRFYQKIFGLCLILALGCGACGDVVWFVSWNAGQINDAQQNGLILVIGTPSTVPLQSVALVDGEIPQGMALQEDGTVRGIPEESGTFDFTVEATEITGKVLRNSYSVEVEAPAAR